MLLIEPSKFKINLWWAPKWKTLAGYFTAFFWIHFSLSLFYTYKARLSPKRFDRVPVAALRCAPGNRMGQNFTCRFFNIAGRIWALGLRKTFFVVVFPLFISYVHAHWFLHICKLMKILDNSRHWYDNLRWKSTFSVDFRPTVVIIFDSFGRLMSCLAIP